jgi:hypothetical protein
LGRAAGQEIEEIIWEADGNRQPPGLEGESQSWGLCHSRGSYYQVPNNLRVPPILIVARTGWDGTGWDWACPPAPGSLDGTKQTNNNIRSQVPKPSLGAGLT